MKVSPMPDLPFLISALITCLTQPGIVAEGQLLEIQDPIRRWRSGS